MSNFTRSNAEPIASPRFKGKHKRWYTRKMVSHRSMRIGKHTFQYGRQIIHFKDEKGKARTKVIMHGV